MQKTLIVGVPGRGICSVLFLWTFQSVLIVFPEVLWLLQQVHVASHPTQRLGGQLEADDVRSRPSMYRRAQCLALVCLVRFYLNRFDVIQESL
jgi:hypothetical protein